MRDTIIIPDKTSSRAGRVASHFNHPEPEERPGTETPEQELQRLARHGVAWFKARNWTQEKYINTFGNLVGDRKSVITFPKDVDDWDRAGKKTLGDWLEKYRKLPAALFAYDEREPQKPLLELPHVETFIEAFKTLRKRTSEKRALFVEGEPGTGKTALLTRLRTEIGEASCVVIRGRQSWASFSVMLESWLRALGSPVKESRRPESAARLQERVRVALLSAGSKVIAVDEAHCMHGPGINALRDWINDAHEAGTGVHFVLAAIPTLWESLTGRYSQESAQLVRRLSDRITLDDPASAECLQLMSQSVAPDVLAGLDQAAAGAMLAAKSNGRGSRSFVADVRDAAALFGARLTLKKLTEIADAVRHKNRKAA